MVGIAGRDFLDALRALGAFDAPVLSMPFASGPNPRGSKRRKTTLHKQHGEREKARRRRQIERGSLREANGLVSS